MSVLLVNWRQVQNKFAGRVPRDVSQDGVVEGLFILERSRNSIKSVPHEIWFASEMVVRAAFDGLRIEEVPTLLCGMASAPPHPRAWRDGLRGLPSRSARSSGRIFVAGTQDRNIVQAHATFPPLFRDHRRADLERVLIGAALLILVGLGVSYTLPASGHLSGSGRFSMLCCCAA
jgi:hypothetical protein